MPQATATTPTVAWGPTSTIGLALTLTAALGTVAAAVKGNDTATAVAGASGVLTALSTLGGRYAQAIAAIRAAARAAAPWIDAAQEALEGPPPLNAPAVPPPGEPS